MRFPLQEDTIYKAAYGLFGLPPGPQLFGGIVLTIAGVSAMVALFEAGFVAGIPLLAVFVGLPLAYGGYEGVVEQRSLRRQVEFVRENSEKLIEGILEMKARGGKAVEYLNGQGIENIHIRQSLLRVAKERADAAGDSG